jgi:hypothetical protein
MMTDKSKQMIGQQFDKPYLSRQWIEDGFPVKFTDKQWDIVVDYLSEVEDEEEFEEDLSYAIYNIEALEAEYDEYDEVFKSIHGKTSKELEEGKD